jgi:serine/threonine protein kinase
VFAASLTTPILSAGADNSGQVISGRVGRTVEAMPVPAEHPGPRVVAGRYHLHSPLGRGGVGVVWSATDALLDRQVAVKEIVLPYAADPEERAVLLERTLREARAAARLHHPSIVSVYDVVEDDGKPWIVLELVEARSLAAVVTEDGPLPPLRVAEIGLQLLAGLENAHRAGILHRDVKPGNVLLSADGRARLTDFGIASQAGEAHLTGTGILLGSPAYIAPERARGMPGGPSSDLWALASTLYTVVEGVPAYEGDDALEIVTAVVEGRRRPTHLAGPLGPLLADLLDRSEATRPRATEVRRRLSLVLAAGEQIGDTSEPHTLVFPEGMADSPMPITQQVMATGEAATQMMPAVVGAAPAYPTRVYGQSPDPASAEYGPLPQQLPPVRRRRLGRVLALIFLILIALLGGVALGVVLAKHHRNAQNSTTSQSANGLPKGWIRYHDPSVGYTVATPSNWARVGGPTATTTDFRDPYVRRFLRVDSTSAPQASALDAWQAYEASFRNSVQNYHRVRLAPSDGGNGSRQADWEFTFSAGGIDYHVLDRGLVANGRGYALYWQTEEPNWQSSTTLRERLFAQFAPAP